MQVLMYQGHHSLPFWSSSEQPVAEFNKDEMKDLLYERSDEKELFSESWTWDILDALSQLEYDFLAHVSVGVDMDNHLWTHYKRFWIQFSDLAKKQDKSGLPLIVDPFDNTVQVVSVWQDDNGTYTPYDFLTKEQRGKFYNHGRKSFGVDFWKRFFVESFAETKTELEKKHQKLLNEASDVKSILDLFK